MWVACTCLALCNEHVFILFGPALPFQSGDVMKTGFSIHSFLLHLPTEPKPDFRETTFYVSAGWAELHILSL